MNSVERVKSICKERKIPISKLEKDLGYSNGYISQLRKGVFPADRLSEIARYLSVTPDYLMTGHEKEWWSGGEEELNKDKAFKQQLEAFGWKCEYVDNNDWGEKYEDITEQPYYLFSRIDKAGSFEVSCSDFDSFFLENDRFIKNKLQELANKYLGFETIQNKSAPHTRIYTYYQKIACAGTGFYFDDIPTDTIEAPYMEGADFIIGVNGNSMEPDYHNGENLYIKKTDHINYGDVGIFTINNECYLKEYGRDGLISRNPDHENIQGNEDIRLIGKVIGKVPD